MHYKPSGVCSQGIDFELENGIVKGVRFTGAAAEIHRALRL